IAVTLKVTLYQFMNAIPIDINRNRGIDIKTQIYFFTTESLIRMFHHPGPPFSFGSTDFVPHFHAQYNRLPLWPQSCSPAGVNMPLLQIPPDSCALMVIKSNPWSEFLNAFPAGKKAPVFFGIIVDWLNDVTMAFPGIFISAKKLGSFIQFYTPFPPKQLIHAITVYIHHRGNM